MHVFLKIKLNIVSKIEGKAFNVGFLSSPLAGKRDIVVTILVRCMSERPCIQYIHTIMHGFQNNLAQLLSSGRRSAI